MPNKTSSSRFVVCMVAYVLAARCAMAQFDELTEQQAADALRPAATNIQFNKNGTVRLVRMSKPQITDESLSHLKAFSKIDYLAVVCPQVTDAGLANIVELSNLDTLLLSTTQVSDKGLSILQNLKRLERLYLEATPLSGKGLAHLGQLENLQTLSLADTHVGDEALVHLQRMQNLRSLNLTGTLVTDAGMVHLKVLNNLRSIQLARTDLRGAGLKYLAQLEQLEHLNLDQTKLTGPSLAELGQLKLLKSLSLCGTELSEADVAKLQQLLAETMVVPRPSVARPSEFDSAQYQRMETPIAEATILSSAEKRFLLSSESDEIPHFQRHVVPLLGRLGCNGRTCHGSFQGQAGFRLSMFGYDFAMDLENLTGGGSPRVDVHSPNDSLILNKPTDADNHEGGLRFEHGGWEYQLLRRWIAGGAKGVDQYETKFARLEVSPANIVFREKGATARLRAIAVWSDGSREDVTCLTRFESKDDAVAEVDENGLVRAMGRGDTYILSFYDNGITSTEVVLPVFQLTRSDVPPVPTPTPIDALVVAKLTKLGIVPSGTCRDEEFLRRVSLDLIGTLPTPDEILEFVSGSDPEKRSKKITELLERPAYVTWWTTKLADLTGSNAGYLGSTDMAPIVADQWNSWLARRIQDNIGWDKIVEGIVLATSRRPGQSYEEFAAEQSAYTRREDPADFTSLDVSMPHYWFRDNQALPKDKALTFGYTFLGIRLDCAECHKHPYDQWSQRDFQQFTEFFTRIKAGVPPDATTSYDQLAERLAVPVKLNTAALRRQSYRRIAAEGWPVPWKEVYIEPPNHSQPARLLGGEEIDLNQYDDPREPLIKWLTDADNPYLARSLVNRIWSNYFNRGIVEPPDDLNRANPPSNEPLLDWLAQAFIANGFDLKWLHTTIANTQTYQASRIPNKMNLKDEKHFSHAVVRRLPAEVIMDAIYQATSNERRLATTTTIVAGRKIGQHPKSYQARSIDFSLLVLGKPLRTTTCDCERKNNPNLLQSLYVRNDEELLGILQRPDGWLVQLAKQLGQRLTSEVTGVKDIEVPTRRDQSLVSMEHMEQLIREAYLRTLSRLPNQREVASCRSHIQNCENTVEGMRDVMWTLLNTQEFITNH